MAKERLEIELVTEAKKAIKNLNDYVKATGKAVKAQQTHAKASQKAGERVGKLTKLVKSYFAEITAGILVARKLIRIVGDLTKAYMAQEDSVASMEAALRATGSYTPTLSQNLQDLAADLQDITKYGDESTLEMAGLLQSLADLNGEGLLTTIPLVQDFATGMKIDLQTAASLIGKTLGSTTNALSRYGIILDMTGTQQEKLAELADVVNSKFGGMAAAMGKTYAGEVTILKNAFGDLKEEMGRSIAMGIKPMLPLALTMVEHLKSWITETNNLKEAKRDLLAVQKGEIELTQLQILQKEQTVAYAELEKIQIRNLIQVADGLGGTYEELSAKGEELVAQQIEDIKWRQYAINGLIEMVRVRDEEIDAIKDTIKPIKEEIEVVIEVSDAWTRWADSVRDRTDAAIAGKIATEALTKSTFAHLDSLSEVEIAYKSQVQVALELAETEKELHEQRLKDIQEYLTMASEAISQISGLFSQYFTNQSINLENNYQTERDAIMQNITDKEQQETALEELDEKYDKKRAKLMTKQARAEKVAGIISVAISTSMAIMKAFAQLGPIAGAIAAAFIGAAGLIQAALIAKQPIPKFAKGGSFTTSGPELIQVGDNPGGRERVTVTPESSTIGKMGNINIIMPITFGTRMIKEEFQVALDKGDIVIPERVIANR